MVKIEKRPQTISGILSNIPYRQWNNQDNLKGVSKATNCGTKSAPIAGKNGSYNTPSPIIISNFNLNIPANSLIKTIKIKYTDKCTGANGATGWNNTPLFKFCDITISGNNLNTQTKKIWNTLKGTQWTTNTAEFTINQKININDIKVKLQYPKNGTSSSSSNQEPSKSTTPGIIYLQNTIIEVEYIISEPELHLVSKTDNHYTSQDINCANDIKHVIKCTGEANCIDKVTYTLPYKCQFRSRSKNNNDTATYIFRDTSGTNNVTKKIIYKVGNKQIEVPYYIKKIPYPTIQIPSTIYNYIDMFNPIISDKGCPSIVAYINTTDNIINFPKNDERTASEIFKEEFFNLNLPCGTHRIFFKYEGEQFFEKEIKIIPLPIHIDISCLDDFEESLDENDKGNIQIRWNNPYEIDINPEIISDTTHNAQQNKQIQFINGFYEHKVSLYKPGNHRIRIKYNNGCEDKIINYDFVIKATPLIEQKNSKLFIEAQDGTSFKYKSIVGLENDNIQTKIVPSNVEMGFNFNDNLKLTGKAEKTRINNQGFLELQMEYIGDKDKIDGFKLEINIIDNFSEWNDMFKDLESVYSQYNQDTVLQKNGENVYIVFNDIYKNRIINVVLPFISNNKKERYLNFLINGVPIEINNEDLIKIVITDYYDNTLFIDGENDLNSECNPVMTYKCYINDTAIINNKFKDFKIKNTAQLIPLKYWNEENEIINIPNDEGIIDYETDNLSIKRKDENIHTNYGNQYINLQMFYGAEKIGYYREKSNYNGIIDFDIQIPVDINDSPSSVITYQELINKITLTTKDLVYSFDTNDETYFDKITRYFINIGNKWYIDYSLSPESLNAFLLNNPEIKYIIDDHGYYEIIDYNFKGYIFKYIDKEPKFDFVIEPIQLFDIVRKGDIAKLRFKFKIIKTQFINEINLKQKIVDNYTDFKIQYKLNRGIATTKYLTNDLELFDNNIAKDIYCDVQTNLVTEVNLLNQFTEIGRNNVLRIKVRNGDKNNKNIQIKIDVDNKYEILPMNNIFIQNNIATWIIPEMEAKTEEYIDIQLKSIELGKSNINVKSYDYMNIDYIQTFNLSGLIINSRKPLIFNVEQSHSFVYPGNKNKYRITIKNPNNLTMNNVQLKVLHPDSIIFDNSIEYNNINNYYEIGDLDPNRSVVFDLDTSINMDGIHNITFICYGDYTPIYDKTLQVECGYIKTKYEMEHNIIFYNFTPYEQHYKLTSNDFNKDYTSLAKKQHKPWFDDVSVQNGNEINFKAYERLIDSLNKDELTGIHIPRENYHINIIEQYKGSNIQVLIDKINKKSKYVNIKQIRTGTNFLQNNFKPIYPNGLIHRFGLLVSELYHHTGVLCNIKSENYNIFKWKPKRIYTHEYPVPQSFYWNTKKWVGVLYTIYRIYLDKDDKVITREFVEKFSNRINARQFVEKEIPNMEKYLTDTIHNIDYEITAKYYDGGVFSVNIPIDDIPSNFHILKNDELFSIIEKTKPFGLRPIIKYTKDIDINYDFDTNITPKITKYTDMEPFDIEYTDLIYGEIGYDYLTDKFKYKGNIYYDAVETDFDLNTNINLLKADTYDDSLNLSMETDIEGFETKHALKLKTIEDYIDVLNENISFYREDNIHHKGNIVDTISIENNTIPNISFEDCSKMEIELVEGRMNIFNKISNIDINEFGFYIEDLNSVKTYTYNNEKLKKTTYINNKVNSFREVIINDFNSIGVEKIGNTIILSYLKEDKWYYFDKFEIKDIHDSGVFFYKRKINNIDISFNGETYRYTDLLNKDVYICLPEYREYSNFNIDKVTEIGDNNKWTNLFRVISNENTYAINKNDDNNFKKPNKIKLSFNSINIPSNIIIEEIKLKNIIKADDIGKYGTLILKNNISNTGNKMVIYGYNKGDYCEIKIANNIFLKVDKGYFKKEVYIGDNEVNLETNDNIIIFKSYIKGDDNETILTRKNLDINLLDEPIFKDDIENGLDVIIEFDELAPLEQILVYLFELEIIYKKIESSFTANIEVENDSKLLNIKNDGNGLFTHELFTEEPLLNQPYSDRNIALKDTIYQSFICKNKSITSIEFDVQGRVGNPDNELEISIYTDYNNVPDKKVVSKNVKGWFLNSNNVKYDFYLDNLIVGNKYWIKLSVKNKSKINYYLLRYMDNYNSIGKLLYIEDGDLKNLNNGKSCLAFKINGIGLIEEFNYNLNKIVILEDSKKLFLKTRLNSDTISNINITRFV